jgi:hypothetical protein
VSRSCGLGLVRRESTLVDLLDRFISCEAESIIKIKPSGDVMRKGRGDVTGIEGRLRGRSYDYCASFYGSVSNV